jgi:hypothetical protein
MKSISAKAQLSSGRHRRPRLLFEASRADPAMHGRFGGATA